MKNSRLTFKIQKFLIGSTILTRQYGSYVTTPLIYIFIDILLICNNPKTFILVLELFILLINQFEKIDINDLI